ncbi:MAG: hypothetical protein R3C13_03625 [Hyphomonas sp.]
MNYIEDYIAPLLRGDRPVVPSIRQSNYKKALKRSFRLDLDSKTPKPATVRDLQEEFGFSEGDQYAWRLAVTKPLALIALRELCGGVSERTARGLNITAYENRFKRPPHRLGNYPRTMLLTYAEWFQLIGYEGREPPLSML